MQLTEKSNLCQPVASMKVAIHLKSPQLCFKIQTTYNKLLNEIRV